MSGNDCDITRLGRFERISFVIESQSAFLLFRAVALVTALGQERLNIALEIDWRRLAAKMRRAKRGEGK